MNCNQALMDWLREVLRADVDASQVFQELMDSLLVEGSLKPEYAIKWKLERGRS